MKTYFYNPKNEKDSKSTDIIRPAINGRYGLYCKSPYGNNYSERAMEKDGWKLVELSKDIVDQLSKLQSKRLNRINRLYTQEKLAQRSEQVNRCLGGPPLQVERNQGGNPFVSHVVNLSDTHMIEAYRGCGKGTAYFNESGELVAFHYGYMQPENAPEGRSLKIQLSATQICI